MIDFLAVLSAWIFNAPTGSPAFTTPMVTWAW